MSTTSSVELVAGIMISRARSLLPHPLEVFTHVTDKMSRQRKERILKRQLASTFYTIRAWHGPFDRCRAYCLLVACLAPEGAPRAQSRASRLLAMLPLIGKAQP
jgi:hypothetical protein